MPSSKERLLKCIRHEPIDRVPISTYELVGWNECAWENKDPSYRRLMEAIREYTDCIFMTQPEIKEKPDLDGNLEIKEWREGESTYTRKIYHAPGGDLSLLYRVDDHVHTRWTLKHLLEEISDIDKYLSIPYETPEIDMKTFNKDREVLGEKGLIMLSVDDPICLAAELFEMGMFLSYAVTEPEKIKYFLDAIHERQMVYLKNLLKHNVKEVIFRICGPEYATPPYLSPRYFPDYVTCYLKEITREISGAGGIARIHSHGKIGKVIEQLAMTEAVGLDPLEPPPDGDLELSEIKRTYGKKFCLFGNIELKELELSSRERIDSLVKKAMEDAKEGSGFVLMPTAAPINSPLSPKTEENYLRMIESAYRYGKY